MTFRIEGDMTARLDEFDPKVRRGILAAAHFTAPLAESFMKSQAPWTDRTGAARNGLGTKVEASGDRVAIILFHSVPYGVYLETRWGGKYAIIEPAMAATGPLFIEAIQRLVFDE